MIKINYYEVLEVSQSASQEIIKVAYRNLAKKYHPDIVGAEMATKKMQELNEAYETLSNPEKRKKYDTYLSTNDEESSYDYEEVEDEYIESNDSTLSKVIDKFEEDFSSVLVTVGITVFCYLKGWNNWLAKIWFFLTVVGVFMFFCEVIDLLTENEFIKKVLKSLAFCIGVFVWFKLTR